MKEILCILVCVFLLFVQNGCVSAEFQTTNKTTGAQYTTTPKTTTEKHHEEIYVYITYTGTKYHEYYCGCLWNSCIETTLEDAIYDGYTPCKRCQPPVM